jgi:hypothetical protein
VAGNQRQIDALNTAINGSGGILPRLTSAENRITDYADSASWIQQNKDSITATVGYFDSNGKLISTAGLVETGDYAGLFARYMNENNLVTEGSMSVQLEKYVLESDLNEEIEEYLAVARISADIIDFKFNRRWSVKNGNDQEVMYMEPNGDLYLTHGVFYGDIVGATVTTGNKIRLNGARTVLELDATYAAAGIIGTIDGAEMIRLGFVGGYATLMVDNVQIQNNSMYIGSTISLYKNSNGATLQLDNLLLSGSSSSCSIYGFSDLEITGSKVLIKNIPSSKPSGSGYLYNGGGTVKVS